MSSMFVVQREMCWCVIVAAFSNIQTLEIPPKKTMDVTFLPMLSNRSMLKLVVFMFGAL